MATFAEIKAAIARDMNKEDVASDTTATLTDSTIAFYVKRAIRYFEKKRFFFNETSTTLTTTAAAKTVSLPADFVSAIGADIESYKIKLERASINDIRRMYASGGGGYSTTDYTGIPRFYASFGTSLYLYPEPDAEYSMTFYYVKKLTELSGANDTNAWTTDGEAMIYEMALSYIYKNRRHDPELAQIHYAAAIDEYGQLKDLNLNRISGGTLSADWV